MMLIIIYIKFSSITINLEMEESKLNFDSFNFYETNSSLNDANL